MGFKVVSSYPQGHPHAAHECMRFGWHSVMEPRTEAILCFLVPGKELTP